MNLSASSSKTKNVVPQLQEKCLSTSIYSFQALDEVVDIQYQKLNPKISGSSSDFSQPPEDRELEKVNRLLSRLKNQQQLNQSCEILETTQFATVRNKMNDFFLALFLRPSERDSISIPADTILLDFHRFFPFFEEEEQVELLDALSSMLLQVSPSETNSSNQNLQTYKATVNSCILTLKKCIKINFPTHLTIAFIKSVLQNSIKIASNVSQISKSLISNAVYVGEFLPFIAEIEPLMSENDQDMNRLVQQFYITCILFTLDNPNYLSRWDPALDKIARFIPPLIQRKPKIDFSSTKVRIQELLSLYNIQKYRKSDDVIPIFNKYLTGLPTKQLQQMDLADVIYAMSIYFLEKMRAERGIFGPILEYMEVKYIPHFSGVLNTMLDPLLSTFYQYLATVQDLQRRNMCASFTMSELIRKFASANQRVQTRVDPILKAFTKDYPIVICNTEVLNSISNTFNELNAAGDQQRIQAFSAIVDKLFQDAFCYVPNSFYAAIFHSQVKNSSSICSTSSSLLPILQNLPQEIRYETMQNFMLRSVIYGQAQFANEQLIRTVQNDQERFLLAASYATIHPDSEIIMDLIAYNEPETLMLAWTHVAMASVEMSKLIIPILIQTFVDLAKNNVGIFGPKVIKKPHTQSKPKQKVQTKKSKKAKKSDSDDDSEEEEHSRSEVEEEEESKSEENTEENEDDDDDDDDNPFAETLVIDEKAVQYQTTLLQFFIENITLNTHYADYLSVLMCASDRKFISHACIVPAIISYAYIGCLIMKSPFKFSAHSYDNIQKTILKLSLMAYSFTYDDYVLKYITQREIFLLEQLIFCLPDVLESGYEEHNKAIEAKKQNDSEQISSETGNDLDSQVSQITGLMFDKVEERYLNNHPLDKNYNNLVKVVAFLLCDEIMIFNSFINQTQISPSLQRLLALRQVKESKLSVSSRVKDIWKIAPEALYPFCKMPRIGQNVLLSISSLMESDHYTAPSIPMLATVYALSSKPNLNYLGIWQTVPGSKALSLLTPALMKNKISASYVARCFQRFTKRESLLFLPQLVQSLRFDKSKVLQEFLTGYCKTSEVFCHYLLWNILAEKNNPVGNNDNLPGILKELEKTIIDNMNPKEKKDYENEFGLIDKLDQVSQKLLPMEIDQRPPAFVDMLNELELPEGLYIPSNPNYKILSIDSEHSVPLKSHARVPILVHFMVYDDEDQEKKPIPFSCIFKIQDDVRQDAMMIQFIDMTRQILTDAGIDHYLMPYRVFATGENRGVIECIQRAKSRHDLGVATNEDLLTYFINKYGQVGTPEFTRAQDNFIKSVAPYSLICYLFQVKDRHNANIMIDEDGHVLHIDFGFIFEISPGGNMKFEKAPFKLTREMIDVMGGSKEAAPFQKFVKLFTQCFFAVRARHEELEAITLLMMNAGFPCFLSDSIKKLQARMFIEKSAKETCTEIVKLVDSSFEANSTTIYDSFQKAQNDIWF